LPIAKPATPLVPLLISKSVERIEYGTLAKNPELPDMEKSPEFSESYQEYLRSQEPLFELVQPPLQELQPFERTVEKLSQETELQPAEFPEIFGDFLSHFLLICFLLIILVKSNHGFSETSSYSYGIQYPS